MKVTDVELTERQTTIAWRALIEFGYENLKRDDVVASVLRIKAGADSKSNVIDVIVMKQIQDAIDAVKEHTDA